MKPTPLQNRGQTCYFNSLLQALRRVVPRPAWNNDVLLLDFVRKERPSFTPGRQHDSHELLLALFDIERKLEEQFEWKVRVTLTCECGYSRSSTDVWCMPTLGRAPSLAQSLKELFSPEILTELKCEKCATIGKTTQTRTLQHLPDMLVFCFPNPGVTNYPERLQIGKHPIMENVANIYHIGDPHGGHYYADILQDGMWWRCDDANIYPIRWPSPTAYMMFYTKVEVT